jgi:hypothetical protein
LSRQQYNHDSIPYVSIFKPHELRHLQHQFDQFLTAHYSQFTSHAVSANNHHTDIQIEDEKAAMSLQWPLFNWLRSELIPRLINFVSAIDLCYGNIVYLLTDLFSELALTFGQTFAALILKSQIEAELTSLTNTNGRREDDQTAELKRERLVQAYLVGVLSHLPSTHLNYFKELILHIALEEGGWNSKHIPFICDAAALICQQSPQTKEYLLTLLADLVVHVSSEVRYLATKLLSQLLSVGFTPDEITSNVLPALLTLSSDPERKVRMGALKPLVTLTLLLPNETTLSKVSASLDSFLNDSNYKTAVEVVKNFASIIPNVTNKFRDRCILRLLSLILSLLFIHAVTCCIFVVVMFFLLVHGVAFP